MLKITLKKHHFKPYIQKIFSEPPANGSALRASVVYQLYGPLEKWCLGPVGLGHVSALWAPRQ